MGKNKLRKFKELESNPLVLQYPFGQLAVTPFPLKGRWRAEFFHNDKPIVLELGCGKGEYTVGLARRYPDRNFIGIDIKGARMWTGATEAMRDGMTNVAFLRTSIELLASFFAPGEVDEIWITFPDPQMRKVNKRLTGTRMLALYRSILVPGGTIHLKSDSPFLYAYTNMMAEFNKLDILASSADIYSEYQAGHPHTLRTAVARPRTHYQIPGIQTRQCRQPCRAPRSRHNRTRHLPQLFTRLHTDARAIRRKRLNQQPTLIKSPHSICYTQHL